MRRAAAVALAWLAAGVGCGSDDSQLRRDPFSAVRQPGGSGRLDRAAPRWQPVRTLQGGGDASPAVHISKRAIQWRARWRCAFGRFALTLSAGRTASSPDEIHSCPASGSRTSIREGKQQLAISSSGRWRISVEEQVDTPLHEAPLHAMQVPAARVVARGRFHGIERRGRGRARVYRLPDGRLALRLVDFATAANTDLFVWLSEAARPRTTKQAFRADHVVLAPLKSTLGDQNYILPAAIAAGRIRSVVVWCEPVQIAYAYASLTD